MSETQTKCPLDKGGEVVRIGKFEMPSSESLTDINEDC